MEALMEVMGSSSGASARATTLRAAVAAAVLRHPAGPTKRRPWRDRHQPDPAADKYLALADRQRAQAASTAMQRRLRYAPTATRPPGPRRQRPALTGWLPASAKRGAGAGCVTPSSTTNARHARRWQMRCRAASLSGSTGGREAGVGSFQQLAPMGRGAALKSCASASRRGHQRSERSEERGLPLGTQLQQLPHKRAKNWAPAARRSRAVHRRFRTPRTTAIRRRHVAFAAFDEGTARWDWPMNCAIRLTTPSVIAIHHLPQPRPPRLVQNAARIPMTR